MSSSVLQTVRSVTASSVVPGVRVRRSNEVAHIGEHQATDQAAAIELVKDGDVVQAIDVTCQCGHKFRLWCVYEPE